MQEEMGYRNIKLVQTLATQGRITTKRGETRSFDPMQFSMLLAMASESFDWPLDAAAKKNGALPRIYRRGWPYMARALGMTITDSMDEVEVIGNEPRAPKLELKAMQRLSSTAKKLEKAGLIKCLRRGKPAEAQQRGMASDHRHVGGERRGRSLRALQTPPVTSSRGFNHGSVKHVNTSADSAGLNVSGLSRLRRTIDDTKRSPVA